MAALSTISTEELRLRLENGDDLVLVDALSALSFAHSRLPGAVNIQPERVDELAPRLIPSKGAPIVVYCQSIDCDSSVQAAERLSELGYTNVAHYPEGKRGWQAAGLPFERGPKEARVRRG